MVLFNWSLIKEGLNGGVANTVPVKNFAISRCTLNVYII